MEHTFTPVIRTIDKVPGCRSVEDIKSEPMIFSGDLAFARKHGGPLTNELIDKIGPTDCDVTHNIVIDTRSNMLMKEYYPSIPGWHCDDAVRTDGQPDPSLNTPWVKHYLAVLSTPNPGPATSGISGTQFVTNTRTYKLDKSNVWRSLDACVNSDPDVKLRSLTPGDIVSFNQDAVHRAREATYNGWRFFFRLSVTHRKPANEIRTQVQTYVDLSKIGW